MARSIDVTPALLDSPAGALLCAISLAWAGAAPKTPDLCCSFMFPFILPVQFDRNLSEAGRPAYAKHINGQHGCPIYRRATLPD
jgi:hypothetical protein